MDEKGLCQTAPPPSRCLCAPCTLGDAFPQTARFCDRSLIAYILSSVNVYCPRPSRAFT